MKYLFIALFAFNVQATPKAETPKILEPIKEATDGTSPALKDSRVRRAESDYLIMADFSPLDLIIPLKYGGTLAWIRSADTTWELEYLHGSVSVPLGVANLGGASEERISLIRRSYLGNNSFNLSYGLSYFNFKVHLGDAMVNRATGGYYPSIDLVGVESIGFNAAFGNRWTLNKNITLGIDWFSWAQPIYVTNKRDTILNYASNENDRDDVNSAINFVSHFPRFAFVKLQLGISF